MNTKIKADRTACNTTNESIRTCKSLFDFVLAASLLLATAAPSFAARNFQENHPRRSQLNGRFAQLNSRMSGSYGQLGGQYQKLQGRSNRIQSQARQDAQANGGSLTTAEQGQFNKRFSALGQQVSSAQAQGAPSGQWMQNHPRRAQVLNSAAGMNQSLSNDYGNLGGHYVGLEQRDNRIRQSSMRQAKANGGSLTAQEQSQLDNRESNLQTAISQDSGQ